MRITTQVATVLLAICVLTIVPAAAQDLVLEAVDSGNYDMDGDHSANNTYYPAGDVAASGYSEIRNFFVFDLSGVTAPVVGATLELCCPSDPPDAGDGYRSPDPFERYALWEVVTDVPTLRAGGTGLTGIYEDLGGGTAFGQIDMTAADNGTVVSIGLNHNAEAARVCVRLISHGDPVATYGPITACSVSYAVVEPAGR